MGKIKKLELSDRALKELELGQRDGKKAAFRKRCQMILLKSQGRSSEDIGKITGASLVTVNSWIKRYKEEGISGLHTRAGRGRRAKLDSEKDAKLVKAKIKSNRQRIKQAKAEIEKETGKNLSVRTLRRFLKKLTADMGE